jgi:hypothetical protein
MFFGAISVKYYFVQRNVYFLHLSKQIDKFGTQVARQECHNVPREVCTNVPKKVEKQQCAKIPRENCYPVIKATVQSNFAMVWS